jgi:hypothetical protein
MRTALAVSVLAGFLSQAPTTPAPAPQAPSLSAAQALIAAGDNAGARAMLEKMTGSEPKNFRAWSMLGAACRRLNDNDCAIASFNKALGVRPDDPQTLVNMGIAHAAKGDLDSAFAWLGKARATKRVDMTQLTGNAAVAEMAKDKRYAALMPTADDFKNPFVEPTRIIQEIRGEAANDQFGWIARVIGDVDGDRVTDFVTSAPTSSAAGTNAGRVYVYSSKTGKLLWKADGQANDRFGQGIEAAGDVNGDGVGDVIAASPFAGYAKLLSGRDGALLHTLKGETGGEAFGMHVSGMADVNGDRVPDVIVGAPGNPRAPGEFTGRAYIFSGKDGSRLLMLKGERAADQFGAAVTGSTRAGRPFFVVGAPAAGPRRTGRAYIYTSLTGKPAFVVDSDETGAALAGMFVSVPGDLDGDKVEDVFLSDWPNAARGPSTGRVYVHSGASGQRLYAITGENAGDGLGTSQSIAGDVDGDGTPDLIVGAWQYAGAAVGGGRAYLHSGKTGALIRTYTCRTPGDAFGFDAVGMGDVDGDSTADLLLTSAWSAVNGFHSGRVFIISSGVTPAKR